jgi:hypothetical protein
MWLASAANLLLAIPLLFLIWYVIFRANRSMFVSIVFVLIGLGITFASAIDISLASTLPPIGIVELLMPNSHLVYVAAFITIIGIAGFGLPRHFRH